MACRTATCISTVCIGTHHLLTNTITLIAGQTMACRTATRISTICIGTHHALTNTITLIAGQTIACRTATRISTICIGTHLLLTNTITLIAAVYPSSVLVHENSHHVLTNTITLIAGQTMACRTATRISTICIGTHLLLTNTITLIAAVYPSSVLVHENSHHVLTNTITLIAGQTIACRTATCISAICICTRKFTSVSARSTFIHVYKKQYKISKMGTPFKKRKVEVFLDIQSLSGFSS